MSGDKALERRGASLVYSWGGDERQELRRGEQGEEGQSGLGAAGRSGDVTWSDSPRSVPRGYGVFPLYTSFPAHLPSDFASS